MYKWLEHGCENIFVSTWISAWNLAFPAFISPIVRSMCENLHYDQSAYFKELHNNHGYNIYILTHNIQSGGSFTINYY